MVPIRIWIAAAAMTATVGIACAAACNGSNPGYVPYAGSGANTASSGTSGGSISGDTVEGASSGTGSGSSSGSGASSGSSCPATYFPQSDGGCTCPGNALPEVQQALPDGGTQAMLKPGAPCTCEFGYNAVCPDDAGAQQCANTTIDPLNCGACGNQCLPGAGCVPAGNAGTVGACGPAPTELVMPSSVCHPAPDESGPGNPIRLQYYAGKIYWSDMGSGTINKIATTGGVATVLLSGELAPGALIVYSGSGPSVGTLYWIDGGNNTIRALAPGATAKTLLTMGPPGDASISGADNTNGMGIVHGLATSPDGSTLYFSAGTNIYKMPSSGGASTEVGYAEGPAHGIPYALAADDDDLYYPAEQSGNVEIMSITTPCNSQAALQELCPIRVGESQSPLLGDTIDIGGGDIYWATSTVHQRAIAGALDAGIGAEGMDYPSLTLGTGTVTGFAIGPNNAYYGEDGAVERGSLGGQGQSFIVAVGQPMPSSFVLDGKNVYWTTSRCDITMLAAPLQ